MGLGAQSLSEVTLAYNSGAADKRLEHYQRQVEAGELPIQDLYHLSREAAMGKMISVSFYFGEINLASFRHKFGLSLEEAFPAEVAFLLENGLMAYSGGGDPTLRLTASGEKNYNGVIALFYAGAVKAHLLEMGCFRGMPSPASCGWIRKNESANLRQSSRIVKMARFCQHPLLGSLQRPLSLLHRQAD